jgi:hypothetical protein
VGDDGIPTAGNKNALAKLALSYSSGKLTGLKEGAESESHQLITLCPALPTVADQYGG